MTFLLNIDAWVISVIILVLMLISTWLGILLGKLRRKHFDVDSKKENSSNTGYLSGLLFFILAFTFNMSANRYDTRRKIVVEFANKIEAALVRADFFPPEERSLYRKDFEAYIEARIQYAEESLDFRKILAADSLSRVISSRLWERTIRLFKDPATLDASRMMLQAINEMIEISNSRLADEKSKVPESILWMLFALACITAFYSGYAGAIKGRNDWLIEIGFCVMISLVILFTLNLDRPRRGFITLETVNQSIIDLNKEFKK